MLVIFCSAVFHVQEKEQNILQTTSAKYPAFLERVRSAVAKAMAGQGDKNNEADVRLLFPGKEVFPLSPHHLPQSNKETTLCL